MAITAGSSGTIPVGILGDNIITNTIMNATNHLIQGQMVTAEFTLTGLDKDRMTDDQIKSKLLFFLADEMMRQKCVEFTKQDDFVSNVTVARARIFVTPDTNVRILREMKK